MNGQLPNFNRTPLKEINRNLHFPLSGRCLGPLVSLGLSDSKGTLPVSCLGLLPPTYTLYDLLSTMKIMLPLYLKPGHGSLLAAELTINTVLW